MIWAWSLSSSSAIQSISGLSFSVVLQNLKHVCLDVDTAVMRGSEKLGIDLTGDLQ